MPKAQTPSHGCKYSQANVNVPQPGLGARPNISVERREAANTIPRIASMKDILPREGSTLATAPGTYPMRGSVRSDP